MHASATDPARNEGSWRSTAEVRVKLKELTSPIPWDHLSSFPLCACSSWIMIQVGFTGFKEVHKCAKRDGKKNCRFESYLSRKIAIHARMSISEMFVLTARISDGFGYIRRSFWRVDCSILKSADCTGKDWDRRRYLWLCRPLAIEEGNSNFAY